MAITHVCQHWREVALECSNLWTNISFSWSRPWVEEMLFRSKQAKLNIKIPELYGSARACAKASIKINGVVAQSLLDTSRLKTLECHDEHFAHAVKALTTQASHLEKLVLKDHYRAIGVHMLPPDFLAGRAPNLKTLKLRNWSLAYWSPLLLTALTEFDWVLDSSGSGLSATGLLDALDGMPKLARLYLSGSKIPLISEELERTVRLPRLEHLGIDGVSVKLCTSLLNALVIPSTAKNDVSRCMENILNDTRAIDNLASAFSSCCLDPPLVNPSALTSTLAFKHISVGFSERYVDLKLSTRKFAAGSQPDGLHRLLIHCDSPGSLREPQSSLSELLRSLPLNNVCRFDLSDAVAGLDILPLFDLPHIETVQITSTKAATTFLALSRLIVDLADDYEGLPIPFPTLKNLLFSKIDFKHDPRRPEAIKPSFLASFLRARKAVGAEIHRLRLDKCPMYKKDRAKFQPQCKVFEVSYGDDDN
jgi:hypothetical protein